MMAAESVQAGYPLSRLLQDLDVAGELPAIDVCGLSSDSREVRPGDLFLAGSGGRSHGLMHAGEAVDQGAIAVAWEPVEGRDDLAAMAASLPVPVVAVSDLRQVSGMIADRFFEHPSRSLFTIGITGTDGKTSCSHFIAQALDRSGGARCGLIGTLGYGLYGELAAGTHTTPDALRLHRELASFRDRGAGSVVMEVSSHGLEQGRLGGLEFDIAVLTNLGRDHLDYHGDQLAYAAAKRKLFEFEGLDFAVLNADDAFGLELLKTLPAHVNRIAYGLDNGQPDLTPAVQWVIGRDVVFDDAGIQCEVETPWGCGLLRSRLLGRFNLSNLLAALSVLCLRGMSLETALVRLAATRTVPGRMERFDGGPGAPLVVVDYAHTPGALEQVLAALRAHCHGEIWCVFGAGGDRDQGKRALMGAVAERFADHIVLTDDNPRHEEPQDIVDGILSGIVRKDTVRVERDRRRAIALAIGHAGKDDIVLVAGKGHETIQLIGDRSVAFSDREQVPALLRERSG